MVAAIDPEILKVFGVWGSILVLKTLLMAPLTGRHRFAKKIFANPEDAAAIKRSKVVYDDPDIERVRRAHLNDLENILPWFLSTYMWLGTGPSTWMAGLLIRGFVIARLVHTLVYVIIPQQPMRAISFFVGFAITGYQAVSTILYYLK